MKYVFFDLDGTVTESAPGIINSVVYAIGKMNAKMPEKDVLYKFVGPPLSESFVKYCGVDPSKTSEAITFYREYYTKKGMIENSVYPGIGELTAKLKAEGVRVVLATSKPQLFAEQILTYFGIRENFDGVFGNTMGETYADKTALLKDVFKKMNVQAEDLGGCVMVGDRSNDVEGAHGAGIRAIGVLYGYGDRAELEDAGADVIAETVEELAKILAGGPLQGAEKVI
ncbi:MAG: HAD hydrolase-like protein [Clostridia bacterium]|nr:HAD hydrolase-like protein [Clostridia bacterium]